MPSALSGLRHPASASCLGRHSRLAGRCPNNSSLFPPLAAVVVVAAEIVFLICCSETPAGVSEQLFYGEGVNSCNTPSVCSLRSQPPSPRGRLQRWRATLRHCQKPSPWGRWLDAKRQDGRGFSRARQLPAAILPSFTTTAFAILRRAGSYTRQTGTRQQPGRNETKGANLPCFKALGRCSAFWAAAALRSCFCFY